MKEKCPVIGSPTGTSYHLAKGLTWLPTLTLILSLMYSISKAALQPLIATSNPHRLPFDWSRNVAEKSNTDDIDLAA